ncbi:MAG: DUF2306 domain-containing protein [Bacteroidota bacterium]
MGRINKFAGFVFAFLSIAVGLYPILYFFTTENFGLLYPKADHLSANFFWSIAFYGHLIFHGLALLVGWSLFPKKMRDEHPKILHNLRKIYVGSALVGGISNIGIGLLLNLGWSTSIGFVLLGLVWLYTTKSAYTAFGKKDLNLYNGMIIYSIAACFAAVTLRLWLPILQLVFGDFLMAYKIVAWLCWVPNLIFAHLWVRRKGIVLG